MVLSLSTFPSASVRAAQAADAPTILYVPLLGQSNASNMRNYGVDNQSGFTQLEQHLSQLTGLTARTLFTDSQGRVTSIAVGGSTIDGNQDTTVEPARIWWYPQTKTPGPALVRALSLLKSQYEMLAAQGKVRVMIIWGQGERHSHLIRTAADPQAEAEHYRQCTSQIFDVIKSAFAEMGVPVEFFLMQTSYPHPQGAINAGMTPEKVAQLNDAVDMIRAQQKTLAQQRGDTHIALNYDDLPHAYDDGIADDYWHMAQESYEVMGQRLAESLAAHARRKGWIATIHAE